MARRVTEGFGRADVIVHVVGGSHAGPGGFAALDDAVAEDKDRAGMIDSWTVPAQ